MNTNDTNNFKKLVLIDGNAILHRAFHALPPSLTNKKGELTNAVYGFVSMLLKVIEDLKPTYLAVCFDTPKPTFRNKLFKDYQINRPEMDKGLVPQIDKVHKVVKTMGFPVFEKDGFEADDVLGTIVNKIRNSKLETRNKFKALNPKYQTLNTKYSPDEVVIVTGDRDLLQLVDEKVKLFMPVKGLNEAKLYGEKEAEERMGVKPSQIPDFKALAGDPSDNYPGVAGIGPKTAANLLHKFKNINNLYKHIDQVENPGVKEKLIKDKENAFVSYKLATVDKDAPIEFDIDRTKLPADLLTIDVIDAFGNLGFKTLLKRLSRMTGKQVEDNKIVRQEDSKKIKNDQMELF